MPWGGQKLSRGLEAGASLLLSGVRGESTELSAGLSGVSLISGDQVAGQ